MLIQSALFGDGPLGREICGDEAGIRALPAPAIHDFWGALYRPANTVVAVAGDIDHEEAVELAAAAFGSGNGAIPGAAPAPALPAGPRVLTGKRDTSQAQLAIARARASAATTPTPGPSPCSTRCWATGCRAACSSACARRRASPTT